MTVVEGSVESIGLSPLSGLLTARVARFRPSGGVLLAPESVPYPIVAGQVSADLAPGPAQLTVQVGSHARERFDVVIPDEGPVTLADLVEEAFEWTPEQVSEFVRLRDEAAAHASAAAGSAADAGVSAGEAAGSASDAASSATGAAGSAASAASSATAAASDAADAAASASAAAGSASDAADSASAAASSASAASDAALVVSDNLDAITAAPGAAAAAGTARDEAEGHAAAAGSSASAAAGSATDAASSASDAASSATSASGHASDAADSATAAEGSATAAASSVTAAEGHATTAAGHASDAAASATAAATDADRAQQYADSFDLSMTAVTGDPGTPAQVVVSGDGPAYEVEVTVPQGARGPKGDDGEVSQAALDAAVASLVDGAPEALDTLTELAAALGNDPNFATTVSTEIGKRALKDGAPTAYDTLGKLVAALEAGEIGGSTDAADLTGALTDAVDASGAMVLSADPETGLPGEPRDLGTVDYYVKALTANISTVYDALDGKADVSHTHTKSEVGLGNVDNTSDAAKPISTATQAALTPLQNRVGAAPATWRWDGTSLPTSASQVHAQARVGDFIVAPNLTTDPGWHQITGV